MCDDQQIASGTSPASCLGKARCLGPDPWKADANGSQNHPPWNPLDVKSEEPILVFFNQHQPVWGHFALDLSAWSDLFGTFQPLDWWNESQIPSPPKPTAQASYSSPKTKVSKFRGSCTCSKPQCERSRLSTCVAGVPLLDINAAFAWQAWHNSFTHDFVTHNSWTHSSFRHNLVIRNSFTYNCWTHSSFRHNSFTHNSLTNNFFTELFYSHNFVTHTQVCLSHTHSAFTRNSLAYNSLCLSILRHLLCPFCFPRAASTTVSDYRKKLTCGVIRSWNLWSTNMRGKNTCQERLFNSW